MLYTLPPSGHLCPVREPIGGGTGWPPGPAGGRLSVVVDAGARLFPEAPEEVPDRALADHLDDSPLGALSSARLAPRSGVQVGEGKERRGGGEGEDGDDTADADG